MKETDCIKVDLFGQFKVEYKGKIIAGGRSKTTQYDKLMLVLLYFTKEGVFRDILDETLFDGKDLLDSRHATQSILFNTKKAS